jgi:hypothetical protein
VKFSVRLRTGYKRPSISIEMKKIFSKLENKNEEKSAAGFVANYTGKVFQIGKHSVVVEEILAEGKDLAKSDFLSCSIFDFLINIPL